METFYFYCTLIAGTLFVLQFLLSLLGFGDHADTADFSGGHVDFHGGDIHSGDVHTHSDGFDHGGAWFAGMLSFRAIVAAGTVFGLAGLAASRKFEPLNAFFIARASGGAMLFAVARMMQLLYKLKSDGTARIERTVGRPGTIYLSVPGRKAGAGKVTVELQGRTMEYEAITDGEDLPSGAPVVVVNVISPGVLEVAKAAVPVAIEGESHV